MNFCACQGEGFVMARSKAHQNTRPFVFKCGCVAGDGFAVNYPLWSASKFTGKYEALEHRVFGEKLIIVDPEKLSERTAFLTKSMPGGNE